MCTLYLFCDNASLSTLHTGPFKPSRLKFEGVLTSHKSKTCCSMKSHKISCRTTEKQKEKVQCAVTPESYPILPVELSEKKKPRGCARNWQVQMRLSWGEACTLHPLPYPSSNPLQDDTFHVASQFSSTPGGRVRYQCRKLLKLITVSLSFLNISWKEAASLI